jgi:hypothetical protein
MSRIVVATKKKLDKEKASIIPLHQEMTLETEYRGILIMASRKKPI